MSGTVIIVGAGPAGLMLACELGLAGVQATILEQRAEPADVSAGMAIHGRTLAVLRQRGLAERIGPDDIFAWPLTPFALLWLDMTGAGQRDHTFAYPQWRLERLLADRAVQLGADIRRGHSLVDAAQSEHGVTVEVASSDGTYRLRGDYLVGCDGADSRVRELAGIGFPASGEDYYGVLGDMEPGDGADDHFDAGLHPGGMFGAIPLNSEVIRLMTIEFGQQRPGDDVPVTAGELQARIGRVTGTEPRLGRFRWISRFGAPTRLAERYRNDRLFLAGDAAHSFFISGTQGINTGIHDALNLGWKLAATLNHHASEDLLDSYHAERWPVGQRMCSHAGASIALLHPYQRIAPLREMMSQLIRFEDVNRYLLDATTKVRYPVPDETTAHPLEGTFLSDALDLTDALTPDAESLTAPLRTGRGVLLDFSDGAADLTEAGRWADRVDVVPAKPTANQAVAALLIRPDGYIAHAMAAASGVGALLASLSSWFGPGR